LFSEGQKTFINDLAHFRGGGCAKMRKSAAGTAVKELWRKAESLQPALMKIFTRREIHFP